MANCWYIFGGAGFDPLLASSYRRISGRPGCLDGSQICAIYSPSCGTLPDSPLSSNLQTYITNGLSTHLAQPQTPAFTKLFVYLKN